MENKDQGHEYVPLAGDVGTWCGYLLTSTGPTCALSRSAEVHQVNAAKSTEPPSTAITQDSWESADQTFKTTLALAIEVAKASRKNGLWDTREDNVAEQMRYRIIYDLTQIARQREGGSVPSTGNVTVPSQPSPDSERSADVQGKLVEALRKIACFGAVEEEAHLAAGGGYGLFDEPHSVQVAREALALLDGEQK